MSFKTCSLHKIIFTYLWLISCARVIKQALQLYTYQSVVFLAPLVVGHWAYVMAHCPSCVRSSVHMLTFISNIFSEITYPILMKFHRKIPALVLFRIPLKNLVPSKLVAMATKLKIFQNL